MTKRELLALAVRVLAIWFLVLFGLQLLTVLFAWSIDGFLNRGQAREVPWVLIIPHLAVLVLLIVITTFLLRGSDRISARLIRDSNQLKLDLSGNISRGVLSLSLICLGLVVLLTGIISLFHIMARIWAAGGFANVAGYLVVPMIKLFLGAFLLLWADKLARWLEGSNDTAPDANLPVQPWQTLLLTVAFRVVGLIFLTKAVPTLIYQLVTQWRPTTLGDQVFKTSPWEMSGNVVSLLLGLFLLLSAPQLVARILKSPAQG